MTSMACLMQGQRIIIPRVFVARTFFDRAMGLMGRRSLPPDTAYYFPQCRSIHTCFMRFNLDVYFLNREGCVIKKIEGLRPWRMAWGGRQAVAALEITAGALSMSAIDPRQPLIPADAQSRIIRS